MKSLIINVLLDEEAVEQLSIEEKMRIVNRLEELQNELDDYIKNLNSNIQQQRNKN